MPRVSRLSYPEQLQWEKKRVPEPLFHEGPSWSHGIFPVVGSPELGLKVMVLYPDTADSSADADGDEKIDLTDDIYILQHIEGKRGD